MLSWRGAAGGRAGGGKRLILFLLDDDRIVQGASPETALDQQVMQFDQARHCHARRAEPHPGAGGRIQHPCRHHDDHAGRDLDVNNVTAGPPLGIPGAEHGARGARASGNKLRLPARYGQNGRAIALNRKNALFAGHDLGAENWAVLASLIETCKLHGVNPEAWLADVLTRIAAYPINPVDELLP
jgi:hypothetical protein